VGLLSEPFRPLLLNKTRRGALTVAGQWRIYTAFPSILLRYGYGLRREFGMRSRQDMLMRV